MMYADKPADNKLQKVAAEAGALLNVGPTPFTFAAADLIEGAPAAAEHELTETFAVWMLNYTNLAAHKDKPRDLLVLSEESPPAVEWTGRWHHQIRRGESAVGYARSVGAANDELSLRQLFTSNLARRINATIRQIDGYETSQPMFKEQDWLVRLLVIPSHHLYAFWLINQATRRSKVLVVAAPEQYGRLAYRRLLNSRTFVELLLSAPPITGIG